MGIPFGVGREGAGARLHPRSRFSHGCRLVNTPHHFCRTSVPEVLPSGRLRVAEQVSQNQGAGGTNAELTRSERVPVVVEKFWWQSFLKGSISVRPKTGARLRDIGVSDADAQATPPDKRCWGNSNKFGRHMFVLACWAQFCASLFSVLVDPTQVCWIMNQIVLLNNFCALVDVREEIGTCLHPAAMWQIRDRCQQLTQPVPMVLIC